jgi:hemin uptake protein HemP
MSSPKGDKKQNPLVETNKEETAKGIQDVNTFGKMLFKSIQENNQSAFLSHGFTKTNLTATVMAKTTNQEVKNDILREIQDDFDLKMQNEMSSRFESLISQKYAQVQIDWSATKFRSFEYLANERRTTASEIEMGEGDIIFEYQGSKYRLHIDKMAKLLDGWKCNEVATSVYPLEY